jgi:hypothetical protein
VRAVVFLGALALVGCGGGRCADRSGSYRARMNLRTGNGSCPATVEAVVNLPAQNPGCVGTSAPSEDNCSLASDIVCPDGNGGTVQLTGKDTWNGDGSSGTSAVSMVSKNASGGVTCQGSYDVTYARL